ncbi:hypothetical protein GOP47_0007455 [Adiantum capillus-veneris]|uniref:Uncharacterized protein n=1 Tax=Adiantum capillus-veneris TaxID=13818 RepID=A0A9D4V1C0_ADICA|nr:hypothetical protein GOP47_0007455 [Adiantum capillus-veneris]
MPLSCSLWRLSNLCLTSWWTAWLGLSFVPPPTLPLVCHKITQRRFMLPNQMAEKEAQALIRTLAQGNSSTGYLMQLRMEAESSVPMPILSSVTSVLQDPALAANTSSSNLGVGIRSATDLKLILLDSQATHSNAFSSCASCTHGVECDSNQVLGRRFWQSLQHNASKMKNPLQALRLGDLGDVQIAGGSLVDLCSWLDCRALYSHKDRSTLFDKSKERERTESLVHNFSHCCSLKGEILQRRSKPCSPSAEIPSISYGNYCRSHR